MNKKHQNPHQTFQQTQPISRADLAAENFDTEAGFVSTSAQVERLNQLVGMSIKTKTGKRKHSKEEAPQTVRDGLTFRLLSNRLPPCVLSLAPKPAPAPFSFKEPEYEDTELAAAVRCRRAREIAVDFSWLLKESSKRDPPFPPTCPRIIRYNGQLPVPPPSIILANLNKVTGERSSNKASSSAFITVPLSEAKLTLNGERKHKRQRGKLAKCLKKQTQPRYWRQNGHGGKSAGYALGFPSNWSGAYGIEGYARDTMRKAVYDEAQHT